MITVINAPCGAEKGELQRPICKINLKLGVII